MSVASLDRSRGEPMLKWIEKSCLGVVTLDRENIRAQHDDGDTHSAVLTRPKTQAKRPSLYKVLLLNDDFTPMDFVVDVLKTYFRKDHAAATEIMLAVHQKGFGVCGVYPYGIAETKVAQVMESARQNQYPLKCTMERA